MNKLETVINVLNTNAAIRAWYVSEHDLVISELTADSVKTYGTHGHGDVADMIIADGKAVD